ncbi:redoxin domain-containing protein [Streptomyces sp. AV19]|uniref:redoxin domain-containing protein n=1 Tax=Streptomyces sp. AV19 TaxID=2793068 RepID=UPI0018FE63A2|nr:redoxin domain-containing protein [Streptomyces sp. AV19]MBH1938040.1 redoxin domain-containing protein [Streptomyces sp. AV19]MDG4536655.1 redoxin domain-containing protein [Streptomyces sp. AV19]
MRARLILPGLLAATALTLTGCGTEDTASSNRATQNSGPAASGSAPATAGSGAVAVPEALRFTGTTVDGRPFDAATLAGKPTVLWFWAPWCPACKAQGPETAKAADRFEGKAHVIGVAGLDKPKAMKDFVTDTRVGTFPNLSDEAGAIWKKFKIAQQSFYVILDKDAKTVFTGSLPAGKGLADKLGPLVG